MVCRDTYNCSENNENFEVGIPVLSRQECTQQKTLQLTVLPPDRSDGLVVELGGVGLAVVGNDEDDGGRIRGASLRIDLDQPERRLPPGDDVQLDA